MRYGSIRYVNNLPVDHALLAGHVARPRGLSVLEGTPAELNAAFAGDRVDVSAVSAATLLGARDTLILPEAAIASHAEVDSVLLLSTVPLDQLEGATIAVSGESATGALMLRVLLERERGIRAHHHTSDAPLTRLAHDADAALLIGDRALTALDPAGMADGPADGPLPAIHTVLDLGEAWRAYTGLPMVYAVWAAHGATVRDDTAALSELRTAITASSAWGREHPDVIIDTAHRRTGVSASRLRRYYGRLTYRLGPAEQAGLARFLSEAAALEGATSAPVPVLPALEATV